MFFWEIHLFFQEKQFKHAGRVFHTRTKAAQLSAACVQSRDCRGLCRKNRENFVGNGEPLAGWIAFFEELVYNTNKTGCRDTPGGGKHQRTPRCGAPERMDAQMTVRDIIGILKAEIIVECNLDEEVKTACGSDMMSDVLAFVKDQSVLLTGLINPQVVRTAEMMDMHCIIFVRGKRADPLVLELAKQKDITVLATPYRMFTACGLLYAAGLGGGCDVQ